MINEFSHHLIVQRIINMSRYNFLNTNTNFYIKKN